jgi:hypothetical protein
MEDYMSYMFVGKLQVSLIYSYTLVFI